MTSPLPLHEKKVLVPRGAKHAQSFSRIIKRYGGIPVEIPLIAFRPVLASGRTNDMLSIVNQYDWILFTSNVTVETFFSLLKGRGLTLPKLAAIGEKTKKELMNKGYSVDFTPTEYRAEGFVREFLPLAAAGARILLPKGNLAREYIASSLKAAGAKVDEVIVYETYLPDSSHAKLVDMLTRKQLDILAFTSPSTVAHFMEIVKQHSLSGNIKDCIVGCIGPETKKKAESLGLAVHASPEKYTVEEMVKSLCEFFGERNKEEYH